MSQFDKALAKVIESIVTKEGFQQSPLEIVEGRSFATWDRDATWKRDIVEIVRPSNNANTRKYVEIIFRVRLKMRDDRESIFDGANLRDLVKKSASYYYPTIISSFLSNRLLREIRGDLQIGLRWFARYETPGLCLNKLRTGQTSLGSIQVGKASKRAEEFLTACSAGDRA